MLLKLQPFPPLAFLPVLLPLLPHPLGHVVILVRVVLGLLVLLWAGQCDASWADALRTAAAEGAASQLPAAAPAESAAHPATPPPALHGAQPRSSHLFVVVWGRLGRKPCGGGRRQWGRWGEESVAHQGRGGPTTTPHRTDFPSAILVQRFVLLGFDCVAAAAAAAAACRP